MQTSTGRLIVPMYGGGVTVCYSDTHGATWHATQGKVAATFAPFIYKWHNFTKTGSGQT